ncbi:MAG: Nif3-like dinuclear metal center hexameric protein [Anaerolineae bacterium]|nr:Nif3-like dinuclear metal center hexameric protein [Anaerolineae bacterium]
MRRDELIKYLDEYLRLGEIEDVSQNGLQVEGPDDVQKVAVTVDASLAAFERAVFAGAQLLIVHHGLFWGKSLLLLGPHFRRIKTLIRGKCGLYGVHLPLDAHPRVGNNAELARMLQLQDTESFGDYHGLPIGMAGKLAPALSVSAVVERLNGALGSPATRVLGCGPERVERIGCVSGGAMSMVDQVAAAGLDTYVTGEADHTFFHSASELGINVLFWGHYATETLGVRALARHLEEVFGLATEFLDIPTGM